MIRTTTRLICSILLLGCLSLPSAKATGGLPGGTKGGNDSVRVADPHPAPAPPKARLITQPAFTVLNPEGGKVAAWDTLDLNIYHMDMAAFADTLHYRVDGEGLNWQLPVNGQITSGFGARSLFGRKFHKGVDIDLETGDEVRAAMNGTVRIARYSPGYGNFVVIAHQGGLETLYGHMSELKVTKGQEIKAGEVIGLGGSTGQSTGSHLHLELRVFGQQIDPAQFFSYQSGKAHAHQIDIDHSFFAYLQDAEEEIEHIVEEGQSLEDIAALYEMEVANLRQLNAWEEDQEVVLNVGDAIKIQTAEE